MKINYTFNNGENSEVEVNEQIGAVIIESRRKEENLARKERYHCVSMEDAVYEGDDSIDERTPESLFMEQLDNEHIKETLDKLSDLHRRRLLMLVQGLTIREIAKIEGVTVRAVFDSIEKAKETFKKNY